ncbi:hypothetical protein OXPF_34580 [Oxobacter pfennigii]|uniref:Uncharacterized protein n=1 Tax=Oxobacter pfennigii TaxID=36849 RepID=A0A0P8W5S0_9CLOT|nr:hypothetical protein [Oxobacter pfennigii]KPU43026.1 hypothetical protein OXPF_34580 [Oxobacter pfennigii]
MATYTSEQYLKAKDSLRDSKGNLPSGWGLAVDKILADPTYKAPSSGSDSSKITYGSGGNYTVDSGKSKTTKDSKGSTISSEVAQGRVILTDGNGNTTNLPASDSSGINNLISKGWKVSSQYGVYMDGSTTNGGGSSGGGYSSSQGSILTPNVSGTTSYDNYIQQLKDAQIKAGIAALDKSRSNALANISSQRADVAPRYYDSRNQLSTQSQLSAKNFAEYMAQRGTSAGAGAQASLLNNLGLQNSMTDLQNAQNREYADLDTQKTLANNAYQYDVAAVKSGAEAQAMEQMIAAQQQAAAQALEQQRYQQQLALSQRQWEAQQQQQSLENQFKQTQWENTLAQQEFSNYMAQQELELARQKAANTSSGSSQKQTTPQQMLDYYEQLWKLTGTVPTTTVNQFVPGGERMGIAGAPQARYSDSVQQVQQSLIPGVTPGSPYPLSESIRNSNYNAALNKAMEMMSVGTNPEMVKAYVSGSNISSQEAANILNILGIPR